jgi:hypothetical protein
MQSVVHAHTLCLRATGEVFMHARISTFVLAVLVVLAMGITACEDNGPVGARVSGPSPFQARLVSVEPAAVVPEFLTSPSCRTLPPFRTGFDLFVHAQRNLFLRRLGFDFRDRSGRRVLPTVFPTFITGVTAGSSTPVPMPTSLPVPIPGTLPFHGAVVSPPFSRIGLVLTFECGVPANGTLFITVETADDNGATDVSQASVRIGGSGS